MKACLMRAQKSLRARVALTSRQSEVLANRSGAMLQRVGSSVRNVAILPAASGRQTIHALRRLQDRNPGQGDLEASQSISNVHWGTDDYEGIQVFFLTWQDRARRAQ
eukprot:8144508-Alexandrium_andersonii.AAC.1